MKNKKTESRADLLSKTIIFVIVIIAVLFVSAGGILYIVDSGSAVKSYSTFNAVDTNLRNPQGILQSALHIDPHGLIQFGILTLIIVPMTRVFIFLFSFITQRDWLYCAITFFILTVLLFSFFGK